MKLQIYCKECKGIGRKLVVIENDGYTFLEDCTVCKGEGFTLVDTYAELKEEINKRLELKYYKHCNYLYAEGIEYAYLKVLKLIEEQEKKL